jgi:anti-sigma B factor antagonist
LGTIEPKLSREASTKTERQLGGVVKASMITGPLVIAHESTPWGAVLSVTGELDVAGVPALRRRLESQIAQGVRCLILDLSETSFIDSVSMAAIVAMKRRMGEGGRLVIATGHPYVLLILEAGGLDSVIEVFESREEAEAALTG